MMAFDSPSEGQETSHPAEQLTSLPDPIYRLLQKWVSIHDPQMGGIDQVRPAAHFRSEWTVVGQAFKPFNQNSRSANSNVIYRSDQDLAGWATGRIQSIFSHKRHRLDGTHIVQIFFIVNPYIPLSASDARCDVYRGFRHIGGRLFYRNIGSHMKLLSVNDIICHFAYSEQEIAGITLPCILALPLSKVLVLVQICRQMMLTDVTQD
jgi:hypothetical protein